MYFKIKSSCFQVIMYLQVNIVQNLIYITSFYICSKPLMINLVFKYYITISFRQFTKTLNQFLLKVTNGNTRKRCEICSKLTIKKPARCETTSRSEICLQLAIKSLERRQWRQRCFVLSTLNRLHTFF